MCTRRKQTLNKNVSRTLNALNRHDNKGVINSLRYAADTTLMAESEEELKSFFMVKEESEKAGLKLNIQKTKITTSGPITSWKIGKKWNSEIFHFLGLQNHCRW